MKSTDNLDRIIKGLEELPDKYETDQALKQNGYVEGVCDSINLVVKLFIHNVSDQRELLIDFAEFYGTNNSETRHERIVDNFLKGEKFKQ